LVLGREGDVSAQEVDEALSQSAASMDNAAGGHEVLYDDGLFDLPLREAREQFERDYLTYQLKKAGGSVGKLADSVGMERTHLYRKLRSLGIDPKLVNNP
jgi:DNA-binding NtrC family response regulator